MFHIILGSAALMAGISTGGFLLAIIGIRRCDQSKRLTSQPAGKAEAFARRMLTGSRGYARCDDPEDGR